MAARATKGFECNECTDCIRLMPSANGLTMGHSKLMLEGTKECTQKCEGKNANGTVCNRMKCVFILLICLKQVNATHSEWQNAAD